MKHLQPHGLEVGFETQILNEKKSPFLKSALEAYIRITNLKNGKVVVLPMRSFVTNFITAFHGFLYGGTNPAINCAIRSVSNNAAGTYGMFLGEGTNGVQLSDTALQTKASSASLTHGVTSFIAPTTNSYFEQITGQPLVGPYLTETYVRRLFTNTKAVTESITELGLIALASNAGGVKLLSRDIINAPIPAATTARFDFAFQLRQADNGYGGAILNLSRLVHNFLLKGNQNDQALLDTTSAGVTLSYSSIGATIGASTALQVDGAASKYYGIVIGRYDTSDQSGKDVEVTPNTTTFNVDHTNITVGACTVSAVSNPYSNAAQFTVTRDFTNTATTATYIDRIGLINRGAPSNAGTTLLTTQMFYAINKPTGGYIMLQPQQTLRVTYTFGIQV